MAIVELKHLDHKALHALVSKRAFETRLGEELSYTKDPQVQPLAEQLAEFYKDGCRFALVGVPEDIGPRANCGRGGSHEAWQAFLSKWLNTQANRFTSGQKIVVLGEVNTDDLMSRSQGVHDFTILRELVNELDQRVESVVGHVFAAKMIPIVIGGGHNNALPILRALAKHHQKPVSAVNCDPHLDFRPIKDGRHSGNPFSYAVHEGILSRYFVVGSHEVYNSEAMWQDLDRLHQHVGYQSFDEILRGGCDFQEALKQAVTFIQGDPNVGLELDLDAMAFMPSSAATPLGFSGQEIAQYIAFMTRNLKPAYLHLPEGAPALGGAEGATYVGKMLSYLVHLFLHEHPVAQV